MTESLHCFPCYDRLQRISPAYCTVMGTPMCRDCFAGKPIGNEAKVLNDYLKEQASK